MLARAAADRRRYIQELGANAVGLSALELMLFDTRQDERRGSPRSPARKASGNGSTFRRSCANWSSKTRLVESAWQGPRVTRAKFAAGGQQQLNLLVNDMLTAIETGAQARLQLVIDRHAERQVGSELVEGGLSGTSQQGLLALLRRARAVFSGGDGIGPRRLSRAAEVSDRRAAWTPSSRKAIDAVQAIDGPLEQAIDAREPGASSRRTTSAARWRSC